MQSFSGVLSGLECSETSSVHLLNCSEFSCQFRAFLAGSEHLPSDSKHFLVGSELILAKFNEVNGATIKFVAQGSTRISYKLSLLLVFPLLVVLMIKSLFLIFLELEPN